MSARIVLVKAFRFRLELTPGQVEVLEGWVGVCRLVWNTGLDQRRQWLRRGRWLNYSSKAGSGVPNQAHELAEAKQEPGLEFLTTVPSQVLQQTLRDLDVACRRHKSPFRVHFKAKRNHRSCGLRFPVGETIEPRKLNRNHGVVTLPKLGRVKYRASRPVTGVVRSATIVRERGLWYISILTGNAASDTTTGGGPVVHAHPGSSVGIDRGVKVAVATSEGVLWDKPATKPWEVEQYKRLQQQLARQKRGSCNRLKTLTKMQTLKSREVNRRTSFTNKVAHTLTKNFEHIALENLSTQNMTKAPAAKPDPVTPGVFVVNGARAKAGLNRAILTKGWYQLQLKLIQKATETQSIITLVDPKYTSQQCNQCGHTAAGNRESQAIFHCTQCGHTTNADLNAAINIKTRGQQAQGNLCDGGSPAQTAAPAA